MAELRKARLETWKEVAAFFGRDERTVKRWEAERGLPIHRLPGGARSRIYAEVEELERWLGGAGEPDGGAVQAGGPARRKRWRAVAAAAALANPTARPRAPAGSRRGSAGGLWPRRRLWRCWL